MEKAMQDWANDVAQQRKELGVTRALIAEKAQELGYEITRATVGRAESGRYTSERIIDAINAALDAFWAEREPQPEQPEPQPRQDELPLTDVIGRTWQALLKLDKPAPQEKIAETVKLHQMILRTAEYHAPQYAQKIADECAAQHLLASTGGHININAISTAITVAQALQER